MEMLDDPAFARMAAIIKDEVGGRRAAFFTVQGNLGDALILKGAMQFLHRNSIPFDLINARSVVDYAKMFSPSMYLVHYAVFLLQLKCIKEYRYKLSNLAKDYDVAILCGSGGWSPMYPHAQDAANILSRHFARLIVLPTTFGQTVSMDLTKVVLFARDCFQSRAFAPDSIFCHDTAFYLEPATVEPIRYLGVHLRTDIESSAEFRIPPRNCDISLAGNELSDANLLFVETGKSEVIVTDRLHVAIAAGLIGRRVYLLSSNYFKIPAIYNSSIKERFPNVTLLSTIGDLPSGLLETIDRSEGSSPRSADLVAQRLPQE